MAVIAAPGDRGDALLQLGDLGRERRLVAHAGGQPAQQAGNLAAGLHEAEHVVHQQQHVPASARRGNTRRWSAPSDPTRQRAPGGSFICPKTRAVRSSTPDCAHVVQQLMAFAGALADAGEHGDAADSVSTVVRISSMISTVLPTPAPPNIAALPPRASGASRSITLMPVSNTSRRRLLTGQWRRLAVDRPARRLCAQRRAIILHLAENVEHPAEHGLTNRRHDRRPGPDRIRATAQAVSVAHRHRLDRALVQVTLNLRDQFYGHIPFDPDRFAHERELPRGKGQVEHRPTHRRNLPDRSGGPVRAGLAGSAHVYPCCSQERLGASNHIRLDLPQGQRAVIRDTVPPPWLTLSRIWLPGWARTKTVIVDEPPAYNVGAMRHQAPDTESRRLIWIRNAGN